VGYLVKLDRLESEKYAQRQVNALKAFLWILNEQSGHFLKKISSGAGVRSWIERPSMASSTKLVWLDGC